MPDFMEIDHSDLGLEADRLATYPHPREMLALIGHKDEERILLDAYRSEKLHHAWMLTGPEGIGKATLAYRFARFLFAHPDPGHPAVRKAGSLAVGADDAVAGQVARQSHPDLAVIRRGLTKDGKSLRAEIAVDDVREGLSIFRFTAGAGGWRVVIVDAADDLNRASANALLKMLEEPPERALFLLITHRPGAQLPTIRSRCRVLRVAALDNGEVSDGLSRLSEASSDMLADAAAEAGGSLRRALIQLDPATSHIRRETEKLLKGLPDQDGKAAMALFDKTTGKTGEAAFQTIIDMVESHLRSGIHLGLPAKTPVSTLAARAELWEKLRRSARDVEDYNLDRRPFLLSLFSELADIERRA